jgi:hypothetical protein
VLQVFGVAAHHRQLIAVCRDVHRRREDDDFGAEFRQPPPSLRGGGILVSGN